MVLKQKIKIIIEKYNNKMGLPAEFLGGFHVIFITVDFSLLDFLQ